VDKDRNSARPSGLAADSQGRAMQRVSEMEELYRKLEPELRRTKPNPDAIAAALEAAQRLAAEADTEQATGDLAEDLANAADTEACPGCGYHNRTGNQFCGMCGSPVAAPSGRAAERHAPRDPLPFPTNEPFPPGSGNRAGLETHHYHHHYHHHYFPAGNEGSMARDTGRIEAAREDRLRPTAALRGDMSRAEAAVRRVTHEWVLACNTKHLDDLLDLYGADALVLRSNNPPVRGAAAVREFFFGALDSGLGEVEMEPLRVEVIGDLAYEAGRCKALVPSATGKRREDRGKYLWVCARQSNGEWKIAADCWSSDLSFGALESDVPPSAGVKTNQPRKLP
jgi:ketosteroid isomerase-like protein